jgi:hypothetical protein
MKDGSGENSGERQEDEQKVQAFWAQVPQGYAPDASRTPAGEVFSHNLISTGEHTEIPNDDGFPTWFTRIAGKYGHESHVRDSDVFGQILGNKGIEKVEYDPNDPRLQAIQLNLESGMPLGEFKFDPGILQVTAYQHPDCIKGDPVYLLDTTSEHTIDITGEQVLVVGWGSLPYGTFFRCFVPSRNMTLVCAVRPSSDEVARAVIPASWVVTR